ncbi:phage major capsid protein [Lysobacter arenosi]|uniref:Phage major capsid protein n=1 Tax=Lysobacter arenosi TaxID=2795387 RepID=A0ABX7RBT7_9GAMM|nr:phage major capsid protein [Lysobacter arenosi]QSX75608.1 phage major capsid protein [Lysobacter arenosi]
MNAVPSTLSYYPARKRRTKARLLFRSCAAHCAAFTQETTPEIAAARLFGNDAGLKSYLSIQRAAVDPAVTSLPDWAGSLAAETWAEFLTLLQPVSVYAQLAAIGTRFDFDSVGKVSFPGRDSSPALAGDFVGENAPIPVKKAGLRAVSLPPRKMAVLSALSSEMSRSTGGRLEKYIRDLMIEDTARVLDTRLLDDVAADAVRPAGLLNNATLTPSAGTLPGDVIKDLKAALAPVLASGGGRRLVWIMNPIQAMSLVLQTDAGGRFVWPDIERGFMLGSVIISPNVPDGTLILVDAAEFATVADVAPQFDVSDAGTIHMEDTAPESLNDGTFADPVISLFQQDALAIRMIQQINWAMRRPGMVSGVTGIQW